MWVDIAIVLSGLLPAVLTIIGGVTVAMRWVVRREMQPIVEELREHKAEQHPRERTQVASAMKREGLSPPDGWNGVAMSGQRRR